MTVAELIEILKTIPQDYEVMFDDTNDYGDIYLIKWVVRNEDLKIIELKENL